MPTSGVTNVGTLEKIEDHIQQLSEPERPVGLPTWSGFLSGHDVKVDAANTFGPQLNDGCLLVKSPNHQTVGFVGESDTIAGLVQQFAQRSQGGPMGPNCLS